MVARAYRQKQSWRPWRFIVLLAALAVAQLGFAPTGQAAPAAFGFGQRVEAQSPGNAINLRGEPGLGGRLLATLPNGTTLTVVGGPARVDGVNWWQVDGAGGSHHGWAAESLLQPAAPLAAPPAAQRAGCVVTGPTYPGLYHCQRAGGVYVVVIDLHDPHVRFETVMAADAPTVSSPAREWVSAMAQRHPGAAAAINGDYFGAEVGPEGLAIRNGTRLDDLAVMERSALILGQSPLDDPAAALPIPAQIARLAATSGVDPSTHFNAIGGGPQVVFDGAWAWTPGFSAAGYRGCRAGLPPEQVINGECLANIDDWLAPEQPWSVAGLTRNHELVLVVAPYARLADTLSAFDLHTALKLDSGSSSQLWYGRPMVSGFGPVANGLLVFYQRSAEVVAVSRWPVLLEGERQGRRVTLRNTGADTWLPEAVALLGPGQQRVPLPYAVAPGQTVTLAFTVPASAACGLQRETWHLAENGQPFPGAGVEFAALVMPRHLAAQRSTVAGQVAAWLAADMEPAWPGFLARLQQELHGACATGAGPAWRVPAGWR